MYSVTSLHCRKEGKDQIRTGWWVRITQSWHLKTPNYRTYHHFGCQHTTDTHTPTHIQPLTHTKVCYDTFPALSRLILVFHLIIFKRIICMSACTPVKTCTAYTHSHTHRCLNCDLCCCFFRTVFKEKASGVSMSRHVKVKRMFLNKCIAFQKIIICCLTCTHV